MTSSAFLRQELATTSRRLQIALRLNQKFTKLRTEGSPARSFPSARDCLRLIESRTAEYLEVLTRYRTALEHALPRKTEPIAPRATGRRERLHTCGVRRSGALSHAAPPGRNRRHA
jgi:hypothetical protein